jgi:hypothetical protein
MKWFIDQSWNVLKLKDLRWMLPWCLAVSTAKEETDKWKCKSRLIKGFHEMDSAINFVFWKQFKACLVQHHAAHLTALRNVPCRYRPFTHSPTNITDTAWHIYGTAWVEYSWIPTHLGSFNSIQKISNVRILTLDVKVCRRSVCCMALRDPQDEGVLTDSLRGY